jgi:hypothetical protein
VGLGPPPQKLKLINRNAITLKNVPHNFFPNNIDPSHLIFLGRIPLHPVCIYTIVVEVGKGKLFVNVTVAIRRAESAESYFRCLDN